jgi:hypothetical protein
VRLRTLLVIAVVVSIAVLRAAAPPVVTEPLTGRQVFPVTNWWNVDISGVAVDARSSQLIDWISGRSATNPAGVRRLHPDFGPHPYGIPYVVVSGDQPRVPLTFVAYGGESRPGRTGPSGLPDPGRSADAVDLHRRRDPRWRCVR